MQQNSFKALIRGSWDATLGQRARFFTFCGLYVIAYVLDLMAPWAIGYTLGVFVKDGFGDDAFDKGVLGILAYTGLKVGNVVFHHIARYLQNTVAFQVRMNVLTSVFAELLRFPLRWHMKSHSGESLSKLHRSAGAVEGVIGTYVWQVIEGMVKIIGAAVCIVALDSRVALNVLFMAIVSVLIMIAFNRKLREKIRDNNRFANKVSSICIDYLFNVVTVKTLGLEKSAHKYLEAQRDEGFRFASDIAKYTELKWSATSLGYSLVIGSSLFIYFLSHQGFSGAFDVAEVYVLLNYLDRIFQAIGSFTAYYGGLIEASTSYEDALAIKEQATKLPSDTLVPVPLRTPWTELRVSNLRFAYESGETRGLYGIDLVIRRGEKIALVGPSGGGKSTVLKVLGGLLEAEECELSTDLDPSLSQAQLAANCILVPQEPEIFSESFLYNLTMGQDFTEEQVTTAIALCKLSEVLVKLPGGLHETLVEKGLNLSGGEKQRIALARGLLRANCKPFVLLDEPTSSLDPASEKEIFRGILSHFSDRCVITACHRLALIPLFDRIILIRKGKVIEQGTFQELLTLGGDFAKAWEDYERREAKQVAAA